MSEEKPLTEEDLAKWQERASAYIAWSRHISGDAPTGWTDTDANRVVVLVAEVRRLRALVVDAASLFEQHPDLWGKHEAEIRERLEREARCP